MPNAIMSDIISAINQYMLFAIILGLITVIVCLAFYSLVSSKIFHNIINFHLGKLILIYFLYIYCFMVVAITLVSREPGSRKALDFSLFSTFSPIMGENIYPLENIILFIPLGVLLPLLWNKFYNTIWCLTAGFILSFCIELTQYITERGYSQIDDILTNVFGTFVGFGISHLMKRIIRMFLVK